MNARLLGATQAGRNDLKRSVAANPPAHTDHYLRVKRNQFKWRSGMKKDLGQHLIIGDSSHINRRCYVRENDVGWAGGRLFTLQRFFITEI